ncbi:MAG: hypothetical protein R3B81_09805 [bacterium]
MLTVLEGARIAQKVYRPSTDGNPAITGWRCPANLAVNDTSVFQGGSLTSSGLQGRVFIKRDGSAVVFAFKGTVPSMMSDLTADLALSLNVLPRQSVDAAALTRKWLQAVEKDKVIIVGHSLGGGIAQVVGDAFQLPFVTYNAPGMLEAIAGIPAFFSGSGRLVRALGGGKRDSGVNYRRSWDLVGNFGAHIGRRVEIKGGITGPLRSHGIAEFITVLKNHPLANKNALG